MKRFFTLLIVLTTLSRGYSAESPNKDPLSFQSGNTKIKLGGFVTLTTATYLEGATTSGDDFPVSKIATDPSPLDENRLIIDPTSTRLSLRITQSTEALGDVNMYVEGDFRGSGNTIRLRIATLDFKGFLVGQTWSNMVDLASQATTIDIQGVNSRTFFRTAMVAYSRELTKGFKAGVSLEYPYFGYTSFDGNIETPIASTPDCVIYLQSKGGLGHIKAAAVARSLPYLDRGNIEHRGGWGAQLSGSLNASKALTLYSQAIYGVNISKYINDLASLSYDLIEDASRGEMLSTPMSSASFGAKLKLGEKYALVSSVSRAMLSIDDDITPSGDTYKWGQYISGSAFYYPTKKMIIGVEYLNGLRVSYSGEQASAQRLNMMVRYLF